MIPTEVSAPIPDLNWLRDHMVVLDESEPDSFESIMEAVVNVLEAAYNEADLAGTTDSLIEATQDLTRALRGPQKQRE